MPGSPPGVHALVCAAELPVPPPPGVTVVPAPDPWQAAGGVARALGVARMFTAAEACEELDRRHEERMAEARHRARACADAAEAARERAAAARSAVPDGMPDVPAGALRQTAREVEDALAELRAGRRTLGPRPHVDAETAHDAREAQVIVDLARLQRAALAPLVGRILAVANAGALAIVAGRVASEAFDPVFVLVAVLPLGALGVVASMVGHNVRRGRRAARRRWAALRSLDVCTLAALDAREAEARAWDARAARMAERRRDLVRAQAAWEALVGPGVRVVDAAGLADAVEEATALEAEAEAADEERVQAAARLQAAEDAGVGGAPVVVVDAGSSPERRDALVRRMAARAGRTPVVVVTAAAVAAPAPRPAPATEPRPAPAPADGEPYVVDLRERVLAGLLRLRARQTSRHDPPGTAASG